jgi:hypothetical protein
MKKLLLLLFGCLLATAGWAQQPTASVPFKDPNNLLADLKQVAFRAPGPKMDSVWSVFEGSGYNKLSEPERDVLYRLSKNMLYRGFQSNPHFESLLACLSHDGLSGVQRNDLLNILDTCVNEYQNPVAANFLIMTRNFLETSMLQRSAFNTLAVEGGSFNFRHIEDETMKRDKNPDAGKKEEPALVDTRSEWFDHLAKEDTTKKESTAGEEPKPKEDEDDGGWGSDDDDDGGWGSDDEEEDDGGWGSDDEEEEDDGGWGSDDDDDDGGWDSGWGDDEEEEKEDEEAKRKREEEERRLKEEEERKRRTIDNPAPPVRNKLLPATGDIPEVTGPFIELYGVNLVMYSIYDTFRIEGTSGSIMGKNKVFVGKGGRADWRSVGIGPEVRYVEFSEYSFNAKSPVLEAGAVTLNYPSRMDSTTQGEFRYMSRPKNAYNPATFPRFISYNSDVLLKDVAPDVHYVGGVMIKGRSIYSESLQGGPASITVVKEGQPKFKATSTLPFAISDSLIENSRAAVVIYQQSDSLMHPAMQVRYRPRSGNLRARKDKHAYKDSPFVHSYHNVEMRGDYLQWDVDTDSIDLRMLNAKVPFTVESMSHFDEQRFVRLKGMSSFHPLVTAVGYRNAIRSNSFYSALMAAHYKLNPNVVRAAMMGLDQQGFVSYDPATDWVIMKPKAVHYAAANMGRADYDNILIRSLIPGQQNMTLHGGNRELLVRGVDNFMISDSLRVIVTPTDREITIKENRNTEFTGKMKAGKFIFEGSDFLFRYDSFVVQMDKIDRLAFLVEDSSGRLEELPNGMVDTKGVLFISQHNNKSGLLPHKDYPRFDTDNGGTFFFGGDEILDGAYKGDSSIYFDVPPFFIDSINSSDAAAINFNGTFISGGIFPEFEENLRVMPDRSFGFVRPTPPEGFQLYASRLRERATYFDQISLDNRGIRGNGRIEYLNGIFYSPDFIFYTDSVITTEGTEATIKPGNYQSTSYPSVYINKYRMRWLIDGDSMLLENPSDRVFTIYETGTTFDGTLAMSPDDLYGSGALENATSLTTSREFAFNENDFLSRRSTFQIKSTDPRKPAVLGERVRVYFDLDNRYADINAEVERDSIFSFPYMQYRTNLSSGHWDFDKQIVEVRALGDNDRQYYQFSSTNPQQYGLAFDAKSATYDIRQFTLNVDGVEGINVANVRILPNEGHVVIRENADMDVLHNSTILLNSFTQYHILTQANVKVRSRRKFDGDGIYTYINEGNDTTLVLFDYFDIEQVVDKKRGTETGFQTTARAQVKEDTRMRLMPGILYKGKMSLVDSKKIPEFDGVVSLDLPREGNAWFVYQSASEDTLSGIYIDENVRVAGFPTRLTTGLYLERQNKGLYGSMLEFNRERVNDIPMFVARGKLVYDPASRKYTVAPTLKLEGESMVGNKFTYDYANQSIEFDGVFEMVENPKNAIIRCSGIGNGNLQRREYFLNTFIALEFEHDPAPFAYMAADLAEETEGANANQAQLNIKLAQFLDPKVFTRYKRSLHTENPETLADLLPASIVFSDVNLQWSEEHRSFYSVPEIGLANIFKNDLDVRVNGYIEIPKIEDNNVMHIYIETKRAWYYIGYRRGDIEVYSSNETFNVAISNKGAKSRVKLADPETISLFLEDFSHKYLGGEYIKRVLPEAEDKKGKKKEGEEGEEEGEKKDGF